MGWGSREEGTVWKEGLGLRIEVKGVEGVGDGMMQGVEGFLEGRG